MPTTAVADFFLKGVPHCGMTQAEIMAARLSAKHGSVAQAAFDPTGQTPATASVLFDFRLLLYLSPTRQIPVKSPSGFL